MNDERFRRSACSLFIFERVYNTKKRVVKCVVMARMVGVNYLKIGK